MDRYQILSPGWSAGTGSDCASGWIVVGMALSPLLVEKPNHLLSVASSPCPVSLQVDSSSLVGTEGPWPALHRPG